MNKTIGRNNISAKSGEQNKTANKIYRWFDDVGYKIKKIISLFFELLFEFVLVNNFLKVSEPFGSVVKHFWLFDALADNLIEDDLKTDWYPALLQIVIVLFPDLFDFRVLFHPPFLTFLIHLTINIFIINKLNASIYFPVCFCLERPCSEYVFV